MGCCVHEDRDSTGDAVTVVSVINYKGGVGKTTLTANIGAESERVQPPDSHQRDPRPSMAIEVYEFSSSSGHARLL
jgi:hypothetical protein